MQYPFIITNSEGSGQPATQYLCGFSGTDSVLIIFDKGGYLILDGRYWVQGESEISNFQFPVSNLIEMVKIHKDYTQKHALDDIFSKHNIHEIFVDSRITSYATVQALEKRGLKIIGEDGVLQKIRELKRRDEIDKIKKAQQIALGAFEKLLPDIRAGLTERHLAARLEYLMKQLGADEVAFPTIIASGPNSALPHATVTDREITSSDAIVIDFGARADGYCCDFTRTVLMPDAASELHAIYSIVEQAQRAAIAIARVGTPLKTVDLAARQVIEDAGYGQYFTHAVGHGVGMEVHELPHVSFRSAEVLQRGHVITIEPGIYLPGIGGVRLEEMMIIS